MEGSTDGLELATVVVGVPDPPPLLPDEVPAPVGVVVDVVRPVGAVVVVVVLVEFPGPVVVVVVA